MGRPRFVVTEKDRRLVTAMAGVGCSHEDISTVLGVTPKTLRRYFRAELDRAAIEANAKVLSSLFEMATTGKNTAAAIFWAKTRCGLREKGDGREERVAPPELVVKVE